MAEENKNIQARSHKAFRNISQDHTLRKRPAKKLQKGDSVIYVSSKTHIKALLEKCDKIINDNGNEVIIYCLGAAIQKGILLALQLCEKHVAFDLETNTFTTELIDDLEPAVDDADYEIQRRYNSALQIRVFRKDLLVTTDKTE